MCKNPKLSTLCAKLCLSFIQHKVWIHLRANGETIMQDRVRYRLPFEPFGALAHWYVKKELKYIFDYRYKVIEGVFPSQNLIHSVGSR